MTRRYLHATAAMFLFSLMATAADWTQFRGPGGNASSDDTVPDKWSEKENVLWKTKLPGLGTSSPITVGDAIFLTCYSGYAASSENPGDQKNLMRHVVCLDRKTGAIRWDKEVKPELPESAYKPGNDARHGYASSTPTSDGEHLYVFFGKSGVFCFDLTGKRIWHHGVGAGTHHWGSASSPLLYKDLLIVNAAAESGAMYGLDKKTGNEVWKTPGMSSAWSSPILVDLPNGKAEVVMNLPSGGKGKGAAGKITAFDPTNGKELWHSEGIPDGYICPSVISHDGIVYAIGGRKNTSVAVKAGGKGEVKPLWTTSAGSNVSSPVYHDGHLYWLHESRGMAYCVDTSNGKQVYAERIPNIGLVYASATLANGKVIYVTQDKGTVVVAAKPKFELIAVNKLDDTSRTNASPVVDNGRLLIRTDQNLYCIGKK